MNKYRESIGTFDKVLQIEPKDVFALSEKGNDFY